MAGEHSIYLASYDNAPLSEHDARYHWALLIAPKAHSSSLACAPDRDSASSILAVQLYHATKHGAHWAFEHRRVDGARSPLMLGRVHFADIDAARLDDVARALGDPAFVRPQQDGWDCAAWARDAIGALARRGWLRAARGLDVDGLFRCAERFSEKLARGRAQVGFDRAPPTKRYSGSRRVLGCLLKL